MIDAADALGLIPPAELAEAARAEALSRETIILGLLSAGKEPPGEQEEDWLAWKSIAEHWLPRRTIGMPASLASMHAAADRGAAHLKKLHEQDPADAAMAHRFADVDAIRQGLERSAGLYARLTAVLRQQARAA